MHIYITRHGNAISTLEDPNRPLSVKGIESINLLAHYFKSNDITPTSVLHSSKIRAQQTAMIISDTLSCSINSMDGLLPNDPIEPIVEYINSLSRSTLFVGHLPFVDLLLSNLIINDPHNSIAAFQAGATACIEKAYPGKWVLNWFVDPNFF